MRYIVVKENKMSLGTSAKNMTDFSFEKNLIKTKGVMALTSNDLVWRKYSHG